MIIDGNPYNEWYVGHVIQPLLVLASHNGKCPEQVVILRRNALERGLIKLDKDKMLTFTEKGTEVIDAYLAYTSQFTFMCFSEDDDE